jgi:hypothetical protein
MLPNFNTRFENAVKALEQVILPAIPNEQSLAREQTLLLINHLQLIGIQWKPAVKFELTSYNRLCELARAMLESKDSNVTQEIGKALQSALNDRERLDQNDLDEIERAKSELGLLIDRVISGSESSKPLGPTITEAILDYGARQAWCDRVWFSSTKLDPENHELPTIDHMLSEEVSSGAVS